MAEKAVNPYAPPVEDVGSTPPQTHLWCVVDGFLAVRHNAFLPPVDLEGDSSGGLLTPVVHTHFQGNSRRNGSPARVRFRGYASVASFEKRVKRRQWITRLTLFGFLLFLGGMASDQLPSHMAPAIALGKLVLIIGLVALIVAIVWDKLPTDVRCHGARDGWFYLRGVSPRSLTRFSARSHETPVMVKRKTFRFFGHRLPFFSLIQHKRFNPVTILVVAFMKARRSPALESLHLHYSEEARRSPESADPALIEQWKKESEGTELAQWRAVSAKTLHLPSGSMGIESLLLLSPDGKRSLTLAIRRFSLGRTVSSARQIIFRSWTADGCIQTITPPCLPIESPRVDRIIAKGKLLRLLDRHMAHVGNRPLISIQSNEELYGLLDAETEEQYAASEAAGLQSPIEIMELPEYPAEARPRATPPPMPI
ncbi:hypothetical protein [Luteolibacter luteus]|uniref:Uncharacterized protein n=1 Tax=Luteolibacter luteus TaxID=2728835 RepID=A0A858RL78_9BACT|nr:hypothetical protein [Luteolibacter luteus]QJE97139.1 hypothetical protein HHL09_15530 [Luteolibacter luteus]